MENNNAEKIRLFVDMDGTLAEFKPVETLETLYEKGYFENLEAIPNIVAAIKEIANNRPDIDLHIMSSYLSDSPYALNEKNAWLNKHLPEIPAEKRIFPPCGKDKKDYVPGGIKETDVLLDDYSHNLKNWEPPAMGIKVLNGINGNNGTWKKAAVNHDVNPQELAAQIITAAENATIVKESNILENRDVQKVFDILEENGMLEQKHYFHSLVNLISTMEIQLESVTKEFNSFKEQVNLITDKETKKEAGKILGAAEKAINSVREKLNSVKKSIKNMCSDCVTKARDIGVSALSSSLDFLKVKPILSSIQDSMKKASESMRTGILRLENVKEELSAAKNHAENVGRAFVGADAKPLNETQKTTGLLSGIQTILSNAENRFSEIEEAATGAIKRVDNLNKPYEGKYTAEKKKPLQERLSDAKEKANTINEESAQKKQEHKKNKSL